MYGKAYAGYSLIELITVIVIAGVLSVLIIPRLDISSFEESGFFSQALAATRYAQKTAIASGCIVIVNIDASGCTLDWSGGPAGAGCPAASAPPDIVNVASGDTEFCGNSSPAAAPTGGSFRFDVIGRPTDNTDTILTVPQDIVIDTRTIRVEAETGYAREI